MVQLSKKIGSAVERELQFQYMQLAADEETAAIARKFARREHSTPKYRHRATKHTTRRSSQRKGVNLLMDFGNEDKTRIGLYLLEVAAALEMIEFKNIRQGKKLTKIVFSLDLVERIDLNERILLARSYKSDPLIDVPKDWELTTEPGKSNTTGGYHLPEIRKRNPLLRNAVAGSIYGQKTIDTLNSLQRTAWRIDVRILEIANSLNEKRFKIGKWEVGSFNVCEFDRPSDRAPDHIAADPEKLEKWKKETARQHEVYIDKTKKSARTRKVLTMAREYKHKTFYLSWNCDWRGRFYAQQSWCTCVYRL